MARETNTRKQLADLVMREARASGKCPDLQSAFVIGPISRGHSNWDIGTSSDGPTSLTLLGPDGRRLLMPQGRRFPLPWSYDNNGACFIVCDHKGLASATACER
jgi:hypothetical protein